MTRGAPSNTYSMMPRERHTLYDDVKIPRNTQPPPPMNETKTRTAHTPTRWRMGLGMTNDGGAIVCHDAPDRPHKQICVVASHIERNRKTPYDAPDAERDANTALIIAAPELLAALEQAVRYIVRLTAHKGNMNAAELAAAEKELEQVSRLESGRWAGDSVAFDLDAAREALTLAASGASGEAGR